MNERCLSRWIPMAYETMQAAWQVPRGQNRNGMRLEMGKEPGPGQALIVPVHGIGTYTC